MMDVFDVLRSVRSQGSEAAHLAPFDWAVPPEDATLCGLVVLREDNTDFRSSACLRCAYRALGAGIYAVRTGPAVVNLYRLIEARRGN